MTRATHYNTLQHTATHCNTLKHTATHCNTLQHTATHVTRSHVRNDSLTFNFMMESTDVSFMCKPCLVDMILQRTATHCNTLQHTATDLALVSRSCVSHALLTISPHVCRDSFAFTEFCDGRDCPWLIQLYNYQSLLSQDTCDFFEFLFSIFKKYWRYHRQYIALFVAEWAHTQTDK